MSKKAKLTIIIISSIVAAILLATVICVIIGNSKNDKSQPTAELATWQSMIADDTPLKNIVTPGAHDAGTNGLPYFVATQDKSIAEILNCGTRYLDLRIAQDKGELKIYHGPSKGVTLQSVLDEVKTFITSNTSETLILDFQHFDEKDEPTVQHATINMITEKLNGLLVTNNSNKDDVRFVDKLTLGQTRGKCLVVWGRDTDDIIAKDCIFQRNNDNGTRPNSVIQSYYTGSLNKKSSSNYITKALPTYIDKYLTADCTGLFVLQGQLTDGLYIFGPKFREATHTDNMDKYVDGLQNSDNLQYINIIMRDFVTPSKNCHILQLNLNKDIVKADCVTAYTQMITDNIK
ncbi:MAG: phosphatidylinositol-specific phospholipase C domain-containing protein [Clostridia bacterium]|nr:phosphatidylinositol-specific phospholipase C domain-containing protein [Clostridia bacterium]